MAKIKHLGIASHDPEKTAAFFKEAMGLREVGLYDSPLEEGVFLTDGDINVAILRFKTEEATDGVESGTSFTCLHHIGFHVDSMAEAADKLERVQAKRLPQKSGRTIKFRGPDSIICQISELGWSVEVMRSLPGLTERA